MKIRRFSLFLIFLILATKSLAQDFQLTQPRLELDGNRLIIFYDIVSQHSSDKFYIWIEIKSSNGEIIDAKSLTGDIGDDIKVGKNKKIIWSPEQDSIYLDEEIFVEVKAEKYIKSYNKGSMIIKSMVFPGWGQTNINKGKPWWLTGVAVYATLTGSYLYNKKYHDSYDLYVKEEDPIKRNNFYYQTQKQLDISTIMLYSAASAWALNVLWVVLTPQKYQPIKHAKISLNPSASPFNGRLLLSLRLDF